MATRRCPAGGLAEARGRAKTGLANTNAGKDCRSCGAADASRGVDASRRHSTPSGPFSESGRSPAAKEHPSGRQVRPERAEDGRLKSLPVA
jgi:hypothetical protein